MENPKYHPKWQEAIDAVRSNPVTRARVEAIIADIEQQAPTWSSKTKLIYDAFVLEGYIVPGDSDESELA